MKYHFVFLLLFLLACGNLATPQSNTTNTLQNQTTPPTDRTICTQDVQECPDGSFVARQGPNCAFKTCPTSEVTMNTTKNTMVEMKTTLGTMTIKLYDDAAPTTTANFKKLVQKGFYNGTIFHRVIKNFMIQGGDPTGTGTGGPGYLIKDEFGKGLKHDKKGILSMANAGPNTGGSQFFITLVPTPWLDSKHAIFGEIVSGQDVLDKIGTTTIDENDRPIVEVKILQATLLP